ncbi:MAG: ThuA domain-containing protein, partial [Halioglobus sp.]
MILLLSLLVVGVSLVVVWQVGAWNLVFPSHHHDTVAPAIPSEMLSPSVLVFSKTNSFRHAEGIAGGIKALQTITGNQQWGIFHTENGAVFNENDLTRFDVVVFLNASGDVLSDEQEDEFQS